MVDLDKLWMRPLVDKGVMRNEVGHVIRGADPEIKFEDGEWHLFHTWGPTNPLLPGGRSPGIYLATSSDRQRGFTRSVKIMEPDHEIGEEGYETFSCDWISPASHWYGLIMKYALHREDTRLVPVIAESLKGPWTILDEHAIRPQFDFEMKQISEPGIIWSEAFDDFGMLISVWAGESPVPATRWSTSWMTSVDFGQNWYRTAVPFARPPNTNQDGSGINAYSQSALIEDPRYPGVLHCLTSESGKVGLDRKGITQWVCRPHIDGLTWHKNPNLLIKPLDISDFEDDGWGHIGAPSLQFDYDTGKFWMAATAHDNKKGADGRPRVRSHLRILEESD